MAVGELRKNCLVLFAKKKTIRKQTNALARLNIQTEAVPRNKNFPKFPHTSRKQPFEWIWTGINNMA